MITQFYLLYSSVLISAVPLSPIWPVVVACSLFPDVALGATRER